MAEKRKLQRREGLPEYRRWVDEIVAVGGILTLPAIPLHRLLVGHLEWLSDGEVFIFPAFGECASDGRIVAYRNVVETATGVCFMNDQIIAGYLCPIDKAAVDDADDYHAAWNLWRESSPRFVSLLRQAREQCLDEWLRRRVAIKSPLQVDGMPAPALRPRNASRFNRASSL